MNLKCIFVNSCLIADNHQNTAAFSGDSFIQSFVNHLPEHKIYAYFRRIQIVVIILSKYVL